MKQDMPSSFLNRKYLLLLFGICVSVAADEAKSIKRHPNVIIILADDMGYGDVSCLNEDAKTSTPQLDAMAAKGMTFTDAHSPASLCTPTRYGLLTGRYAWRGTLGKGVSRQYDPPLIEESRYTMGEMFRSAGYATACIGKWHLGWDWPLVNGGKVSDLMKNPDASVEERLQVERRIDFSKPIANGPTTRGFDHYFGDDVPNYPPYCFIEDDRTLGIPRIYKPDSMYGHPGLMTDGWRLDAVMPALTARAVQYIRRMADSKKPFFLYLSLNSPHVPIAPSAAFRGRSKAGAYGDFVEQTDQVVGDVMDALRMAGIDDNTLVIFSSDNGSPGQDGTGMAGAMGSVKRFGHDPNSPFRGMKTDLWEGGHHVPFFAFWPGKIPAGSRTSTTICLTDMMATCAGIIGQKIPSGEAADSYSILPLLLQGNPKKYRRPYTIHHSSEGDFAIRQENWKLITVGHSGGGLVPRVQEQVGGKPVDMQLYDLAADPGERRNLMKEHPEKVAALNALLKKAMTGQ
jgi:arylsulfatase A-like enzyme